jgi:hypothetical protein
MLTMKQEFPSVISELFQKANKTFQKHILIKFDKISELESKLSKKHSGNIKSVFVSKLAQNVLSNAKSHILFSRSRENSNFEETNLGAGVNTISGDGLDITNTSQVFSKHDASRALLSHSGSTLFKQMRDDSSPKRLRKSQLLASIKEEQQHEDYWPSDTSPAHQTTQNPSQQNGLRGMYERAGSQQLLLNLDNLRTQISAADSRQRAASSFVLNEDSDVEKEGGEAEMSEKTAIEDIAERVMTGIEKRLTMKIKSLERKLEKIVLRRRIGRKNH